MIESVDETKICPLCGAHRHLKGSATFTECAWRQWATDAEMLDEHGRAPSVRDPVMIRQYADWLEENLYADRAYKWVGVVDRLLAGSTDAERLFRMRQRGEI